MKYITIIITMAVMGLMVSTMSAQLEYVETDSTITFEGWNKRTYALTKVDTLDTDSLLINLVTSYRDDLRSSVKSRKQNIKKIDRDIKRHEKAEDKATITIRKLKKKGRDWLVAKGDDAGGSTDDNILSFTRGLQLQFSSKAALLKVYNTKTKALPLAILIGVAVEKDKRSKAKIQQAVWDAIKQ